MLSYFEEVKVCIGLCVEYNNSCPPVVTTWSTVVSLLKVNSAVQSWMSVTPNSIGDVTKVKAFDPSVRKICPVDPSDAGRVNPFMLTAPDPFPFSSKLSFDRDAVMLLSVIVTPVVDKLPLAAGSKVKVVNVPAAGVPAPITVLSLSLIHI